MTAPSLPGPGPGAADGSSSPEISPAEADRLGAAFRAELVRQQTPGRGIALAALAALIGMVLWVAITATTKLQVGYMAVAIGFLVGWCISKFGRNVETKYAVVGALLAVLACVMGNILAEWALLAEQEHVPVMSALAKLTPSRAIQVLVAGFSPMDLLFYGLAIWAGYKYAFRGVTVAEFEAFRSSRT